MASAAAVEPQSIGGGAPPPNRIARSAVFVAMLVAAASQAAQVIAQTANSNAGLQGGQDGMFDAILATPNYKTPVLPDRSPPPTRRISRGLSNA